MEEKKYVKISLGTAICLVIIVLLVIGMFGMYFYYNNDINLNESTNTTVDKESDVISSDSKEEEKKISNYNVEEALKYENKEDDMNYEFLLCQKNTYFSIKKEYPINYDEKLEEYCSEYVNINSAAWDEIESNYTQYKVLNYQNSEDTIKIQKYDEPITIKLARIHESTSHVYSIINGNYVGSKNDRIYKKVIAKAQSNNYNRINKDYDDLTLEEKAEITGKYAYDYSSTLFSEKGSNYSRITGISIMNGNNTSSEEWNNNARAKKIKVTINDEKEYTFDLEDKPEVQLLDLNYTQYTIEKPVDIKIEVLEKYDGNASSDVYISDIRLGFASSVTGAR